MSRPARVVRGHDLHVMPVVPMSQAFLPGPVHEPSQGCWCNPTKNYVVPQTGGVVWQHHRPN